MWYVSGYNLQMTEGDFGVSLPIVISGATFDEHDCVKMTIKDILNGETILEKDFANIVENTIALELTAADTALLPVGSYVYSLDWYQSGSFLCNIIPIAVLKVVEKA